MRRRLAWFLGGFALVRLLFWRRKPKPQQAPEPVPEVDPRAEELRAKLAESRPLVEEREEFESAETPVDEADPEERRRRVHAKGRAAAERMRGPSPPE